MRFKVGNNIAFLTIWFCASLQAVFAQPLDELNVDQQSELAVATISLTEPVHYLNHFPESHGKTLEIYYERMQGASTAEVWKDNETRKFAATSRFPGFTLTTRDQASKPHMVIEFTREAEYSVAPGKDGRSLVLSVRSDKRVTSDEPLPFLPTVKPLAKLKDGVTLTPDQAAAADVNAQAYALMVQGHDALAAKNNDVATDAFNRLLLLPPNDYTQDGQEWIGVARDRSGQDNKAKVEYELYLRMYPDTAGAARVARRMEGLQLGKDKPMSEIAEKKKLAPSTVTYGSISSRYYFGRSAIDTVNTYNGSTTTDTLPGFTDQSMLITSIDVSERYRSEDTDARLVFRDVDARSFLANQPSRNRINAAYGEVKGRTSDYLVRLGRQSSMGAGVLGRFDGVAAGYGSAQELRGNVVAGTLEDYSQGPRPTFYGASVDMGMLSIYGISQKLEGVEDRRAVGAEFRYFEDKKNAYATVDYDTLFKAVNAAQFMGSLRREDMTINFMLDHRRAPSLSIRNALNGATTSSIGDLMQSMSLDEVRNLAKQRTALSNMGQIGIMIPWREKWQVGADVRVSNTTGLAASGNTQVLDPTTGSVILDASGKPVLQSSCSGGITTQGCIAAQPGRGMETSLTGQILGSSIVRQGDIWSGGVTLSSGSQATGRTAFMYNHNQLNNNLTLDWTLQISSYKDQFNGETTRVWPMVRAAYRLKQQIYLDMDLGYERIKFTGNSNNIFISQTTSRLALSTGLRWDF